MTTANNQQDLKNAQSSFNATVPNDAPIQPAQAFVDAALSTMMGVPYGVQGVIEMPSCGITSINLAAFEPNSNGYSDIDLSGNALPTSQINAILAYVAVNQRDAGGTLDLSGINMGTPTNGVANADAQTLATASWSVYINVGGVKTLVT